MKKALFFLVLATAIFTTSQSYASHAAGGEFEVVKMNGPGYPANTYRVIFKLYRDCGGISYPIGVIINAESVSCNQSFTFKAPLDTIDGIKEVNNICPSLQNCSFCNDTSSCSLPLKSHQLVKYDTVITFPSACDDWLLYHSLSTRNPTTNIKGGFLHVEYTLNSQVTNNRSPVFKSKLVHVTCNGSPFEFDPLAFDPDGDSLSFSLVNAKKSKNQLITYQSPYSATYPVITQSGSVNVNSQTGVITFTPMGFQICVVAVEVKEYRNGVLLSRTIRDMKIYVFQCSNNSPSVSIEKSHKDGIIIGSVISACLGDSLDITFKLTDPDTNLPSLDTVIGAKNYFTSLDSIVGNEVYYNFQWILDSSALNPVYLVVKDNACPYSVILYYRLDINVSQNSSITGNHYACLGQPLRLNILGTGNFSWTPTSSIVNAAPDSSWIEVSPTQNTDYIVSNSLGSLCQIKDTFSVEVKPMFNTIASNDTSICYGDSLTFSVQPDSTYAQYNITWKDESGAKIDSVEKVHFLPRSSGYFVAKVENNYLCHTTDTINYEIAGGNFFLSATDSAVVCANDNVQLSVGSSEYGLCGIIGGSCNGATGYPTFGNGSEVATTASPFITYYKSNKSRMLIKHTELEALKESGGYINSIAFNILELKTNLYMADFTVKMACVNDTAVNTNFLHSYSTIVFQDTLSKNLGWNVIPLDTPFYWDGKKNLVIETCFSNSTYAANKDVLAATDHNFTSLAYKYSDTDPGCTLQKPIKTNRRPDIRLEICTPLVKDPSIVWSPAASLSDPTLANPVATPYQSQTYQVTVTDSSGCSKTATSFVEVTQGPAKPVIAFQNGQLHTSGGDHYEWYKDNIILAGENGPVADTTGFGTYHVIAFATNGCGTASDSLVIKPTGIDAGKMTGIKIYPNPANDKLHIEFEKSHQEVRTITIRNELGQIVKEEQLLSNKTLSIADLLPGLYFIEINSQNYNLVRRIIKMKK